MCSFFFIQEGQELIQEKPELRPVVQQKLEEIRECWSDLETTTKAKARQLFENNKLEPAVKSYSDLDSQLSHLEQQPPQLEQAHHLPTFNEQLQKFQVSLKPSWATQKKKDNVAFFDVVLQKLKWFRAVGSAHLESWTYQLKTHSYSGELQSWKKLTLFHF